MKTLLASILSLALLAACLPLAGCQALAALGKSPDAAYIAADTATFNAVAPQQAAYVAADPALTQEQRDRRIRTLQTWRFRTTQAKDAGTTTGAAGVVPPTTLPAVTPIPE